MPVRVRIFDYLGVSDGQVLKSDRTVIRGGSAFDRQDSGDFRVVVTPPGGSPNAPARPGPRR